MLCKWKKFGVDYSVNCTLKATASKGNVGCIWVLLCSGHCSGWLLLYFKKTREFCYKRISLTVASWPFLSSPQTTLQCAESFLFGRKIPTIQGGFRVPEISNSKFKLQIHMKGGVRRLMCRLRKSPGHQTTSDFLQWFHFPQTGKLNLYAGHCWIHHNTSPTKSGWFISQGEMLFVPHASSLLTSGSLGALLHRGSLGISSLVQANSSQWDNRKPSRENRNKKKCRDSAWWNNRWS